MLPNDLKNAEEIVDALFVLLFDEGESVDLVSPNADFDGPNTVVGVGWFGGCARNAEHSGEDVLDCLRKAMAAKEQRTPIEYTRAVAELEATKKRIGCAWYFSENLGPWLEREGVPAKFATIVAKHLNLAFRKGQQLGAHDLREQLAESHGRGPERATIAMLRERLAAADKLLLDAWVSMTREAHEAGKTQREILAELSEYLGTEKTATATGFRMLPTEQQLADEDDGQTAFD